jgi:hypothetical protein
MQCGRTAVQGAVAEGVSLECPVSLSEKQESLGFGAFSKTGSIFLSGNLVCVEGD